MFAFLRKKGAEAKNNSFGNVDTVQTALEVGKKVRSIAKTLVPALANAADTTEATNAVGTVGTAGTVDTADTLAAYVTLEAVYWTYGLVSHEDLDLLNHFRISIPYIAAPMRSFSPELVQQVEDLAKYVLRYAKLPPSPIPKDKTLFVQDLQDDRNFEKLQADSIELMTAAAIKHGWSRPVQKNVKVASRQNPLFKGGRRLPFSRRRLTRKSRRLTRKSRRLTRKSRRLTRKSRRRTNRK
jgi:hypothetical protein